MRKNRVPFRRVAIALRLSFASNRDLLTGITNHAKRHCRWDIQLLPIPESYTECGIRALLNSGIDGILTSEIIQDDIARLLAQSRIPLCIVGRREGLLARRKANIAYVRNDDVNVGCLGAKHLLTLGSFRSYGFATNDSPSYCARDRECGFIETLKRKGVCASISRPPESANHDAEKAFLSDWLRTLPKPAAVMASCDLKATNLIEAARECRIRIPEQVSVLGVDNDVILCEMSTPQLTSVQPDHVREGEMAAEMLEALMRGKRPAQMETLNTAVSIVERESAKPLSAGVYLAQKAVNFINREFKNGIGVNDVVRHLKVSRRLADLRFREFAGQSILQAILACRLREARRLQSSTSMPLSKIISACGFKNEQSARRLLKRADAGINQVKRTSRPQKR